MLPTWLAVCPIATATAHICIPDESTANGKTATADTAADSSSSLNTTDILYSYGSKDEARPRPRPCGIMTRRAALEQGQLQFVCPSWCGCWWWVLRRHISNCRSSSNSAPWDGFLIGCEDASVCAEAAVATPNIACDICCPCNCTCNCNICCCCCCTTFISSH